MTDAPFDMPPSGTWEERGGWVVRRLASDLQLSLVQAAGIVGNLGFESGGFTKLREIGQPEGRGGYGWGQWTADRRTTFLAYCNGHSLNWRSDKANYDYLLTELRGAYQHTVAALRGLATVEKAVFSVGQTYERPGGTTDTHLPGYDDRLHYARRALGPQNRSTDQPGEPMPAPAVYPIPAASALQSSLIAAGYDLGPTGADNDWGDLSAKALSDYYASLT